MAPMAKTRSSGDDSGRNETVLTQLNPIICSTLVFITAFIVTQVFFEGSVALIARALKYTVRFHYSQVDIGPVLPKYWSLNRVAFVHMPAPFSCLFLGIFLLGYLKTEGSKVNLLRLYYFWFMVCTINLFLATLTFAPLGDFYNGIRAFYRTFAILGAWLSFNTWVMCIFAGVAIVGSLLLGYFIRDEVLKFNFSRELKKSYGGQIFIIFKLFLLPLILGTLPLLYLSTEASLYPMVATLLNLGIISVGMLASSFSTRAMTRKRRTSALNQVPYITVGLAAAAWVGVYLFFR